MISFDDFKETASPELYKGTYRAVIEKFLASGMKSAKAECGDDIVRFHRGLYGAARKKQYMGRVVVMKKGTEVYLVRIGE